MAEIAARKGMRWTAEEDRRILELLGDHKGYREIARLMDRTRGGVYERAEKLDARVPDMGGRTQMGVCRLLGVGNVAIIRWRRLGWLRAYKQGSYVMIEDDDLLRFMEMREAWPDWDPVRIQDSAVREWAIELRGGRDRLLTSDEAAARLCVVRGAITQAIRKGRIGAVRGRKRRLVRETDLPLLKGEREYRKAPIPRYQALAPDKLEAIELGWGRISSTRISVQTGISPERIGEIAREILGLPRLGRGYWRRKDRAAKAVASG